MKRFWKDFARGDLWVKGSCLVMGLGCLKRGQIVKGLCYLAAEILYFLFFFGFGWKYLSHFLTLGENAQLRVWNEEIQIYQRVPGDNSMLILLFSVLTIAVTVLFICLWVMNLKTASKLYQLEQGKKHIPSLREDGKTLLNERFHVTLLAAPMTTLLLFTVLPIIFMILIAFTNFDANHQPPGNLFTWTGIQNVTDIFLGNATKTRTFTGILGWTIVWAVFATFTNYIFGMILAIIINNKLVKAKKMWRTWFMIPIAIPQFVSLLLVSRALEPTGAINVALMELGWIKTPLPFLTDVTLSRIVVIVINMWIGIPYTMMTFSGVLMNIPEELYESASIDGAGPVRRFISITLPYALLLKHVTTKEAPQLIKELMIREQADGVIIHAAVLSKTLAGTLHHLDLPHLVIGKPDFPTPICWMDVNHEQAGQKAATYLLDKGYRRMAFLMGDRETDKISAARRDGMLHMFAEEELSFTTLYGDSTYESGLALCEESLSMPERPEIFLCTNNYLAMACLQVIRQRGLSVPQDVAIMTFDNYPFSMLTQPQLTAVEADMFDMGQEAARFILRKIRMPELQTQSYCTIPRIIERKST